jgi:hypothetical protein
MAINYTLSIGNVTKKFTVGEFSNVIVNVSLSVNAYSDPVTQVTGTDEEGNDIVEVLIPQFTYSCGGNVSFDTEELDPESFVDFDSVTKETVIGWLLAREGVETVDEYSYVKSSVNNIQARIDALQDQISVSTDWSVSNAPSEDPQVLEA